MISCLVNGICANAQTGNCEVAMEQIKGSYSGDCVNGKAHGHGKSTGNDVYEGDFKKGYPDGRGKYVWQNRNFYEGEFRKGHLEGQGEMHYVAVSGQDSVIKGFWKNDKYIGQYEKAFVVKTFTGRISKVDCRIMSKKGNSITLTTHQVSGSGTVGVGGVSISNIVVADGTYYAKYDQNLNNGVSTRLQDVLFPFRAVFYLSNGDQTEVIFNEKADYDVTIEIL